METEDVSKLLVLIKGNWYRQPTDDLTIQMWREILGPDLELQDAWLAAIRIIHEPRKEPPTPGELFKAAYPEMQARKVREQASLKRIGEVPRWNPGERRVTPFGATWVADENGIPRKTKE